MNADQLVGWKAIRKAKTFGDGGLLKSGQTESPNKLKAFRSTPIGNTPGNSLWSKPTSGLTIFTDEFSFSASSITHVAYDQRYNGLDGPSTERDSSRIAFLIGNTWYISDKLFQVSKRSVWESVSITLASMTFGMSVVAPGAGPSTPINSGLPFPNVGTITAFGVYIPQVNDRVRIDNFTLLDGTPDGTYGPGEEGDLTPCPDLTVLGNPVPTATPVPNKFCSDLQLKSLGTLRSKQKLSKDIVLNLPARTLKGRRDQALLSLVLFAKDLPIEKLTNSILSDMDLKAGLLRLPATVRADGDFSAASSTIDIKLNKFSLSFMKKYLQRYAKDGNRNKPLFPRVDRGTERLITTGLCTKQFKRLLRLCAERVGIRIKFEQFV